MRVALIVWLALAGPVFATVDGWPALYDVAGVAADDVLNVRERPDAASPVIGTLSHDATGVEVIAPNEQETWGIVNAGERPGWVSLAYLERRPGQWDGALPEVSACFGTEPFWTLLRTGGQDFRFEAMDAAAVTLSVLDAAGSENRRDSFHLIAESAVGRSVAVIETEACSDGMSDRRYGISVQLLLDIGEDTRHVTGCCTLAAQ